MNIDIIFKIAGVGLIIAILNIILSKAGRDEYVMLTTLAGIIIVVIMIMDEIKELFSALEKLFNL
ncbi:MAG: stage III sporulation protein AC [Clostridia bacterium]|nr:stage III sporulation protein AC [Clostridia bacterium]